MNTRQMSLIIKDIVGTSCVSSQDGKKIYDLIHSELKAGNSVVLDFTGIRFFASPFFNYAIGQLLRDIDPEKLDEKLEIKNIRETGEQLVKLVKDRAMQYYRDEHYRGAIDKSVKEPPEDL
jgi:hypothetical protein